MQDTKSLKNKTISALFWSFSDLIAGQVIQLIVQIVLARLLIPKDFGIIGMITIFIAISNSIMECGFGNALIREKDVSQEDYSTAFFFNLIMGLILYVTLFTSAHLISDFFREPQLVAIIRVLAIVLVINSFGLVQRIILTKNIDFKTQTRVNIISSVSSGGIGIILAIMGYGVWSLVYKTLTMQFIQAFLFCAYNRWYPSFVFNKSSFKKLFGFGWKLLVSGLINTIYGNLYYLIIGKSFSATELGYYTNAQRLRDAASQSITSSMQKVSYPVLSSMNDEPIRLKNGYKKIIKNAVYITFPIMIGLTAVAHPLFVVLFGDKWINSVIYFQLLCIAGMLFPIHAINLNILQVKGRTDLFLRLEIIKKILGVATIIIVLSLGYGVMGLLWIAVFDSIVYYLINSYYSKELLSYSSFEQLRDITPIFLISITMGVITVLIGTVLPQNPIIKLVTESLTGVLSYIGLSKLTKIEEFDTVFDLLKSLFRKFRKIN